MSVTRVFLGWSRPLCETVPDRLLEGAQPGLLDLRGTAVVVPTRQASWRLRAALPLAAHARDISLLGPDIVTAQVLLSPPDHPGRASDLHVLLAWRAVLAAVRPGDLEAFLGRERPETASWNLQVASQLTDLRRELADGAWSIGDVLDRLGADLEELDRWQAMAELERRFADRLRASGLRDPVADQLAHARAGGIPAGTRRVVLAALPDPPRLLAAMLETWAAAGGAVDVWVAAPQEDAEAFDGWGRPLPAAWETRELALEDDDILLAANPEDQAARIVELLRAGGLERPGGDARTVRADVAIGVPDRETVAPLQRELAALGFPAFDPRNRSFSDTALFRLLQALLAWRERQGYAETAALLRHPDVMASLPRPDLVLRELDAVQAAHLPVTYPDLRAVLDKAAAESAESAGHGLGRCPNLEAAVGRLEAWRAALGGTRLAAGLRTVLEAVYAGRRLRADRPEDAAFERAVEALDEALRELAAVERAGGAGADGASVLVERLRGAPLRPERAGEPVDLEGWLELAWNPAPVLCVAGMNEGIVPEGRVGDVLLPDSLRRKLALRDDSLRLARDAYLLAALCAQRRAPAGRASGAAAPRVVLVVGKTSAAGDPLRPSRLLFRCPDKDLIVRAHRLFRQPPPVHTASAFKVSFKLDPSRVPPAAISRKVLDRVRATAFRDYLACPLRFYLRHVLGMEASDDRGREPDAGAFGDLVHAVLNAMARDTERIWACRDAARLAVWLETRLREEAAARYGAEPWLGVTLAVESAANRLKAFAARQVEWHELGWDIVESEKDDAHALLTGATIRGRIDRIDRHREDGRVCVLDYKTADKASGPEETHLALARSPEVLAEETIPAEAVPAPAAAAKKGKASAGRPKRWVDLQLPLYREMLRAQYGPDAMIGYVLLPRALGETGFVPWEGYGEALHCRALACAEAVVRGIREGRFWPPAGAPPKYDDFGDLLFDDAARFMDAPPNPWAAGEVAP